MIADREGREVLGGGGAVTVDVRSLGRELRRLWEETSAPRGGGRAITRACTRNLVALARHAGEAAAVTAAVVAASDRHPVRAFVIEAGPPSNPDALEAWLTAHCQLSAGGRHVCCEQIHLIVGGNASLRAAGAVLPLLVPDLPVFLWCTGAPPWDDESFQRLLDVAGKLLVDSATFPDVARGVADLLERREEDWAPADCGWYRLAPWREAVAVCFDDARAAERAADIEWVEIGYGVSPAAAERVPSAAALLAGWILDRVDLARDTGPIGLAARVEAGDGAGDPVPVRVVLKAQPEGTPGEITSIAFSASGAAFSWSIACPGGGGTLTLDATTKHSGTHRHRLPRAVLPPERLLAEALDDPTADPVYERALLRAAALLSGTPPD